MEVPEITMQLAAIQSELKAPKTQYNDFGRYSYRNCEDILEAVKPLLKRYGAALSLSDEIVQVGDRYYIKATAKLMSIDKPDDAISTVAYAREDETKKGMDGAQITGAASSYARKYALNGLFCIDDTKDSDTTNKGDSKPAPAKPTPTAPAAPLVCECCGKKVESYTGANGKPVSAERHAAASMKKFGKVLCLECIGKENKNA